MNEVATEQALAEAATAILRDRLPAVWQIELVGQPDTRLQLGTQFQGAQQLLVEVIRRFKPSDVDALNGRLGRRLRSIGGNMPILVISDYLSPKSRSVLIDEKMNFIDLSGNIRIALDNQGIFVESFGGKPATGAGQSTTLRGATAGHVIRFLIDVEPPYRLLDIASATGINKGYVSKLLDAMNDEGIIDRTPRGPVTAVDWENLVRRRSLDVELLRVNTSFSFITRTGIMQFSTTLSSSSQRDRFVVTGSVAAQRLAPVASASTLMLYSMEPPDRVRDEFNLMPANEGADLILLRPPNDLAFELAESAGGLMYAAPSQVAIDCLSGPGRMPAEGEAVIGWMTQNEGRWRCRDIEDYQQRKANA